MAIHKIPGLAPGTLIYTGPVREEAIALHVFDYNAESFEEFDNAPEHALDCMHNAETATWVNVSGVHDVELVARLGERLDLHKLVMEDIVHTTQRPKLEIYDDASIFIVIRMLNADEHGRIHSEQVALILADNYVVSFQEKPGDVFEPVRNRLRAGKGIIRSMGADYLAYALIDTIVDNYFHVIEKVGDEIDLLEADILKNPSERSLARINRMKREVLTLRKSVWPLREVVSGLDRLESDIIKRTTKTYLRDVYDHTIQVVDMLETYRDLLAGVTDLYMSTVSLKMNEIMKVLTIMGSIFIPLTFVAGIYGMNFDVMPELHWKYGYYAAWGLMATIAITLLFFFRRKKWL